MISIPLFQKPLIIARIKIEIINLRRGLREVIKMNKRIIYIDETIFFGRENKLEVGRSRERILKEAFQDYLRLILAL